MGFLSSIGRMFTGSKPKMEQVKRFTPQQESALNQLMQRGMADTDVGGLEKRYRHLFERDTVPDIAERFTAMGGGQRSGAFEESLRRGGLELSEQLAGLRHQSGMQSLGLGLQPQFDNVMTPGSPGLLGGLMGGLSGMLGGKIGGMFGMGGGGGGMGGGMGQVPAYAPRQQYAPSGRYMPGQPRGMQKGMNPVLLKILQGIQL